MATLCDRFMARLVDLFRGWSPIGQPHQMSPTHASALATVPVPWLWDGATRPDEPYVGNLECVL